MTILSHFMHSCLMLKHKQMLEASCGDGTTTCILCGCELGATQEEGQVPMVYCHTCAKVSKRRKRQWCIAKGQASVTV